VNNLNVKNGQKETMAFADFIEIMTIKMSARDTQYTLDKAFEHMSNRKDHVALSDMKKTVKLLGDNKSEKEL